MPIPKLDLPREIGDDYTRGRTLRSLAAEYKCNKGTIRKRLIEWGIPRRRRGIAYDYTMPPLPAEALHYYKRGFSINLLADAFELSPAVFRKRLRLLGITPRSANEAKKAREALQARGETLPSHLLARAAMTRAGL